ncbi:hypothetical protein [Dongia deserti]|uniref:hypothetical protein n=1 Tax=Dongia deserti TaxID=2268030 RepID=UPI000E655545|nr:hypothetical protein [Dongia deserti]
MAINGSAPGGRLSLRQVFAAPLAIAIVSIIGLVSALVGDDIWDVLSWLTLAVPVAVILWYWLRRPT